jgi:pimeloyl-ACP methyl ester carboxylesterase
MEDAVSIKCARVHTGNNALLVRTYTCAATSTTQGEDGHLKGPVLLLHGFPDTAELWDGTARSLVAAGHTPVHVPDMLGAGGSDAPRDTRQYALRAIVAGLCALLDALGLAGQAVHVIGHDWGAAVGWTMALQAPARVRSLAALSVGHPGVSIGARGLLRVNTAADATTMCSMRTKA